jgi:hypothetical protein
LRHVGGFCWLVEDIAENIVESGIKRHKPLMKYLIAVKPVSDKPENNGFNCIE